MTQECGLSPVHPLVVGVSGGADSLALADCLAALGYPVIVAHFDHRLRPESQADLEFVRDYAPGRDLPFEAGSGDVAALAQGMVCRSKKLPARCAMPFCFDIARKQAAQALAVGHTADDQVETVLMHLLRGAGLDGLKGMSWSGILESVRSRHTARPAACWGPGGQKPKPGAAQHDLDYRVDVTNQDTDLCPQPSATGDHPAAGKIQSAGTGAHSTAWPGTWVAISVC